MAAINPNTPPVAARNPKALSLKALFPTVDLSVIESVLEAHGGSEDRAVESLLGMTDEAFEPELRDTHLADNTAESDASYARALALEEEEQHAAAAEAVAARYGAARSGHPQQQQRGEREEAAAAFDPRNIPYQPRVRRGQQQQQQQQYSAGGGGGGYQPQADYGATGPFFTQQQQPQGPGLEEQFQKLAVSGKRTFEGFMASGFVKGLKDKVAGVQGGITGAPPPASSSNSSRQHDPYYVPADSDPTFTSSGRPSTPSRSGSGSAGAHVRPPQTQNPDFPASDWAIPDDDRPASRSNSTIQAQINVGPPTPLATSPPAHNPLWSSSAPAKRSDELLRHAQTGGRQSPSSSMLGTSPTGGLSSSPGSSKIDFAKLGLLPRQKISLDGRPGSPSTLSTSPSTKPGLAGPAATGDPAAAAMIAAAAGPNVPPSVVRKIEQPPAKKPGALESDDDDDDLGYTKSPFDD